MGCACKKFNSYSLLYYVNMDAMLGNKPKLATGLVQQREQKGNGYFYPALRMAWDRKDCIIQGCYIQSINAFCLFFQTKQTQIILCCSQSLSPFQTLQLFKLLAKKQI